MRQRADSASTRSSLSVVIVTWKRPESIDRCLSHLTSRSGNDVEIVVVDASDDDETATVVCGYENVVYVRDPAGAGHMTRARNRGLLHTTGTVIAFIDDDAYVRDAWSDAVLGAYRDPTIAAACGRTCNGVPGEEAIGVDQIGLVLDDGYLTANFAADPGRPVTIQHGIGANMSFRREVLADLGGFRDDFRGAEAREDTDIFLRVGLLGKRCVFVPGAVVDHAGAPHVRGARFDWRYQFWLRFNHVLLLSRNYGLASSRLRRFLSAEPRRLWSIYGGAPVGLRLMRGGLGIGALASGLVASVFKARLRPTDPRVRSATAAELRATLHRA